MNKCSWTLRLGKFGCVTCARKCSFPSRGWRSRLTLVCNGDSENSVSDFEPTGGAWPVHLSSLFPRIIINPQGLAWNSLTGLTAKPRCQWWPMRQVCFLKLWALARIEGPRCGIEAKH